MPSDEEIVVLDETRQMQALSEVPGEKKKGRHPKEVNALSLERVQATVDRVIQNRMRLMDRYNGISLFRECDPRSPFDGKTRPSDTPSIQTLFELKKLYAEANAKDDAGEYLLKQKERLQMRTDIIKQITIICERLEEHNSKIFAELQTLLDREAESTGGGFNMDELLKQAGQSA